MDLLTADAFARTREWIATSSFRQAGDSEACQTLIAGAISRHLEARCRIQQYYTAIGQKIIIAVNDHHATSNDHPDDEETLRKYTTSDRDSITLPPHPAQIACRAYDHLAYCQSDQAILFAYPSLLLINFALIQLTSQKVAQQDPENRSSPIS